MTSAANTDFGESILILGDFHVPHRTEDIPQAFKTLLSSSRCTHVICVGNLCTKTTEEYVRALAPTVHIVKGDLDANTELPDSKVIKVNGLFIGIIHGHQLVPWGDPAALSNHARSMGVDILIHGHSHVASTVAYQPNQNNNNTANTANSQGGILLVNPGSITGAYSPFTTGVVPSFSVMCIKSSSTSSSSTSVSSGSTTNPTVTVYTYEWNGKETNVNSTSWSKSK